MRAIQHKSSCPDATDLHVYNFTGDRVASQFTEYDFH